MINQSVTKSKKVINYRARSRLAFYIALMALPVIQLCIFYIYVNFNSILLAFQTTTAGDFQRLPAGFSNFVEAFKIMSECTYMFKNSIIFYLCHTGIGLSLAIVFSYYIYKKYPASGFFRVILFLPKIIPSIVFAVLFKYMVTDLYTSIVKVITGAKVNGLLDSDLNAMYWTVLFYNLWQGFGVNVVLFTGTMSSINESLVESAQLDGANTVQEFSHLTLPMIFPTLITFVVVGMAGIFTSQMSLFSLFDQYDGLPIATIGYYLFLSAKYSDLVAQKGFASYHTLAAMGLIFTMIVFPITLTVRKLATKFGPSVD